MAELALSPTVPRRPAAATAEKPHPIFTWLQDSARLAEHSFLWRGQWLSWQSRPQYLAVPQRLQLSSRTPSSRDFPHCAQAACCFPPASAVELSLCWPGPFRPAEISSSCFSAEANASAMSCAMHHTSLLAHVHVLTVPI